MDINMGTVTFSSETLEWAGLLNYSIRFVYFFESQLHHIWCLEKTAWLSSSASVHGPQENIVFLGYSSQRLTGKACLYPLRGNEVVIWIYSGQLWSQG